MVDRFSVALQAGSLLARRPMSGTWDRDTAGYSGFEGTDLERLLRERGVEEVAICGLATEYCVKNTALDAARAGFEVHIDERAVMGIDAGDARQAVEEMRQAGARVG